MTREPQIQSRSALTRRAALTRLGAGGLGMALAAHSLAAAAQEATPPARADLPPALQEFIAGWESHDADRLADAYAEDAILEDVPTGTLRQGRETIRAYHTEVFTAFEDLTVQVISAFAADDWAADEWMLSGRYTGQLSGFPPGEGQQIALRGADILELADGQLRHVREYYDVYGILIQLGILPPPEVATPPA